MDPQQNQYPIDYLNQIAPEQPKTGMSSKKFLLVVGGAILLIIIALVMIFSSGSGGPKDKMQTLAARLITLQDISKKAQPNIKTGSLRATNSNYTIFLANANRDIAEPLKNNGVDVKSLDKTIKTKEDGEDLKTKLEDARLNAVYDRTYAREMAYQLERTAALMGDIYDHTNSKSLKEFLLKTDENLQPIRKTFSDYSDKNN
jgi:LPXTG-motif cell wall-anchored protein